MRKYYSWNIALIVVCFAVAFGIERYMDKDRCLKQYANDISTTLVANEQSCEDLLSEQSLYLKFYYHLDTSFSTRDFVISQSEKIDEEPFTLFLLKKDSVVSASNNLVSFDTSLQDNSFVRLSNGYYFVKKKTYPSIDSSLQAIAFILIKRAYKDTSPYVENTFEANANIPEGISIDPVVSSSYPIHNKAGQTIAFLDSNMPTISYNLQVLVYGLYVLGFVLILILGQLKVQQLKKKQHRLSLPLFVLVFILVALGYHFMDFGTHFQAFTFLKPSFLGTNGYKGSLADVMSYILLLLWSLGYIFNNYPTYNLAKIHRLLPWIITLGEHILIVFCGFMTVAVHHLLIESSAFVFDFNDLYNIDGFNIASIVSILLVWFIYTLVVYHGLKLVHQFDLPSYYRAAISPAIAVGVGVFSSSYIHVGLTEIQISISLYTFIVLFDIFMTNLKTSDDYVLSWGLFGLALYAATSAILLNTFRDIKNYEIYTKYINVLNEPNDSVALKNIKSITQIFGNQSLKNIDEGEKALAQLFNTNVYLPDHYKLNIRSNSTLLDSSIRNFTSSYLAISYVKDCHNQSLGDSVWYRMEVTQKDESKTIGYHEDLFKTPFSRLKIGRASCRERV